MLAFLFTHDRFSPTVARMRIPSLALVVAIMVSPVVTFAAGIRDYSSHKPPSITLPAAGGSYIDPIFGTKIIRVTDSRDGNECYHAYSYWPAFNVDSTRLLIACDNQARLYRFDKSTDKLTADGTLEGDTGYDLRWEGAVWSQYSPNIIYALDGHGTRLWKVDVSKRGARGYVLLKNFSGSLGDSIYIDHLTVDEGADYYSFHTRSRSTDSRKDVIVWDRHADHIYKMTRFTEYTLDETKINKEGTRVVVNYTDGTMALWNFKAGTRTWFDPDDNSDNVSGHYDVGRDFIANSDGVHTGIVVRTFGATRSPDNVVLYKRPDGSRNWTLCDHVSLRTANEEFLIGSTYAGDGSWAAFEDEIFLIYTDGHGFVRLAHSRSKGVHDDSSIRYRSQPCAVVDRLGRYVVYTSDLGSSSRLDVMILKIPSAYWPD